MLEFKKHSANKGNLYVSEMFKVAPNSEARWLHAHSHLFWVVLLWSSALPLDLEQIICSIHHSTYCAHLVSVGPFLTMSCCLHRPVTAVSQPSCSPVLRLPQLLRIRRKTLPQVLKLSATCHLFTLLSAL